jgi:hypothetical protein
MTQAARSITIDTHETIERDDRRLTVLLCGLVLAGNDHFPVRVRTVTPTTALVEARMIPPVGSIVRFSRGAITIPAQVVSSWETGFELEFRGTGDARAMLIAGASSWGDDADEREALPLSKH